MRPVTLSMSHFLGPDSFFEQDFARPWARALMRRADGGLRIDIRNNRSPFGHVSRQAAQVAEGMIDIALALRGAEDHLFPHSAVAELPFVVDSAAAGSRALWRAQRQGLLGREFAGFKLLALCVHNPGLIHTVHHRVVMPDHLRGLRLRAPNPAVATALAGLGAEPILLQVDAVMPALRDGRLDGIVTNWGNPLPGFRDAMRVHTLVPFYSSVFAVVMNRQRFEGLPPALRAAIDAVSNEALVARLGRLWRRWDHPVRAAAAGHVLITPDAPAMALWRQALCPSGEAWLEAHAAACPSNRAAYARLRSACRP